MKMTILTLFPEIVEGYVRHSIMAKAVKKGIVDYLTVNIRDFAYDRHRTCDDSPFGGGPGMVLKPEPLAEALDFVHAHEKRVVFASPSGIPFTAKYAYELSKADDIVYICGRYEGVDQRILDMYVDDEISIGDYVISSGEVSTLVIIDAVYRLLEGVINGESLVEESFTDGLLEYPHYTRPAEFRGHKVPEVLVSGHHAKIKEWRKHKQQEKTEQNRPDLIAKLQ